MRVLFQFVLVLIVIPLAVLLIFPRHVTQTPKIVVIGSDKIPPDPVVVRRGVRGLAVAVKNDRWCGLLDESGRILASVSYTDNAAVSASGYVVTTNGNEGRVVVGWDGKPIGYLHASGDILMTEDVIVVQTPRRNRAEFFDYRGDPIGNIERSSPIVVSRLSVVDGETVYVSGFLDGSILIARIDATGRLSTLALPPLGFPPSSVLSVDTRRTFATWFSGTDVESAVFVESEESPGWQPVASEDRRISPSLLNRTVLLDSDALLWQQGDALCSVDPAGGSVSLLTRRIPGRIVDAFRISVGIIAVTYRSSTGVGLLVVNEEKGVIGRMHWKGAQDVIFRDGQIYVVDAERVFVLRVSRA